MLNKMKFYLVDHVGIFLQSLHLGGKVRQEVQPKLHSETLPPKTEIFS
jgi:hypothetical protein